MDPLPLPLILWRGAAGLIAPLAYRRIRRRLAAEGVAPARISERRGIATLPRPEGRLIWLHAASVGESLSVLPLIAALIAARPGLSCLITTGTAASAEVLAGRLPAGALHQFAPLDAPRWIRRFLRHWRPDLLVVVESELWPGLLSEADRAGIPRALVNARLGAGSLRNWGRFPRTARRLFAPFRWVGAQRADIAAGLSGLGAPGPVVTGDMKAAAAAPPADPAALAALAQEIGPRPVWAAVSTHPGEEAVALAAHAVVRQSLPDALLILCPRHVPRASEVAALTAPPLPRRSAGAGPDGPVWLADTMGETGLWYRLAPVVFLGGSITDQGGHNPWEVARCGAALLHGPHVGNVRAAYAELAEAGAAQEITAEGLGPLVTQLLSDPARARAMGAAGAALARDRGAAVDQTAAALLALLPAKD